MKTQNIIIISILLTLCYQVSGQTNSHDNKLPWVEGNLPIAPIGSKYKVLHRTATTLDKAREKATTGLIMDLTSEKGVKISSQAISELSSEAIHKNSNDNYSEKETYKQITHIKRDDFEANFSAIEEYYEYKKGQYHLWVLFLVANSGEILTNTPKVSYELDKGAWRSAIVPGWGQFYQKQPTKGTLFLITEVALLSSTAYLFSKYSYNNTRAIEANTVSLKQTYRSRANKLKTYGYVALGGAAGIYIFNLVDAFTSKKGKIKYTSKTGNEITITPIASPYPNTNSLAMGVTIDF